MGDPSSRMKNMPELNSALKGRNGANQCMYSTASGRSRSELPSSRATSRAQEVIRKLYAARRSDDTATACVTLMRAALTFPCARWIDATTDAPTPNISPTPVLMRNSGAVMLMAASASLPMPRPTKIPSVITKTAEKTIPRTVGISSFRKSFGISMLPKSILSFIAFVFWSAKILASGRAKVNIW